MNDELLRLVEIYAALYRKLERIEHHMGRLVSMLENETAENKEAQAELKAIREALDSEPV